MKIYIVGGAVRDSLLGLPVQDRDYVVVGATPEQMLARGFTAVGKDFPVFLHPLTHEEYALARTERKTARGYKGFEFHASPDVTLEEDLVRRDLTINAMARDESGALIDPFGGRHDLETRVFRHVSPAFAEDPVRILRLARFAARFSDFSVAEETLELAKRMVHAGEVDALVPERVWQELSRGMMEERPSRMFEVLRTCGALARILPELDAIWDMHSESTEAGLHAMRALDLASRCRRSLAVRFAVLMLILGKSRGAAGVSLIEGLCRRLRIPNDCRDLARIATREQGQVAVAFDMSETALVDLLERCDAWRKPQRFVDMLETIEIDARACAGSEAKRFAQKPFLEGALKAAQSVDAGAIARRFGQDDASRFHLIPSEIRRARIAALSSYMKSNSSAN